MKRSEEEATRILHELDRLEKTVVALRKAVVLDGPIGTEAAQAISQSALSVAMMVARHDAFDRLETERAECEACLGRGSFEDVSELTGFPGRRTCRACNGEGSIPVLR